MSEAVKAFVHSSVSGALVWDANDVHRLRVQFRVGGGLVGALPVKPRQNSQLGLPLLLMPEEVSLLREEGILDLRRYTPPTPSPTDVITYTDLRQTNAQQQLEVYQERRMDQHSSTFTPSSSTTFTPLTHTLTADPREHAQFPAIEWTYPHTSSERRHWAVYRDLWRRGFTLTSGLKYGGDYLVYTGDPALVHSHYLAVVLPWQQPIKSLPSLCRVGSKVMKCILLCSVEDDVVQYQTIQWTGSLS